MRIRKGKGGSTLRAAGTGSEMALYRYFSSAKDNLLDPKRTVIKENAHVRCTRARGARGARGRGIKVGVVP